MEESEAPRLFAYFDYRKYVPLFCLALGLAGRQAEERDDFGVVARMVAPPSPQCRPRTPSSSW